MNTVAQSKLLWTSLLIGTYPDPKTWPKECEVPKRDIYRFARLWLSEGIPYLFRNNPINYERGREQLAAKLGEDPKHISLTGSARLGYSLSPTKFSKPFDAASDLDLFIVSPDLFRELTKDAALFILRFENGDAKPATEADKRYWPGNVKSLKDTIARGFIDSSFIPMARRYPIRMAISDGLVAFNTGATGNQDGGGLYRAVSLRVYRDWDRAVAQIGGSLVSALKNLGYTVPGAG